MVAVTRAQQVAPPVPGQPDPELAVNQEFGAQVRAARKARGLNQTALARAISPPTSQATISEIERGAGSSDRVLPICRYLGIAPPVIGQEHLMGLIAFPSMHTVMALMTTLFARGTRLFWPLVLINLLMIPAILLQGGHHVVDVLGGTALAGGRGTILGTVLGALTIAVIGNGLILAHISPFFTQIVTGLIILLAIWLNTRLFARMAQIGRR